MLYLRELDDEIQLRPGRFPKLVELNINNLEDSIKLMLLVGNGVGLQLQTLRARFLYSREILQLDKLLVACPNLSELCLYGNNWQST